MGRLLPLIEVSVNICAIVSDFTGNSGGLQQWPLLTKCIYLLYRQAVNVKLIQQSLAKTSQILKPKLALLLLQILPYCCSVRYLCSNRQLKQINNSLKTIVEQLNSVFYWKRQKYKGIESVAKNLSPVCKSAGLLDRESKTTVLPSTSKKTWKKKQWISLLVTNNNSSSSQLSRFFSVHC